MDDENNNSNVNLIPKYQIKTLKKILRATRIEKKYIVIRKNRYWNTTTNNNVTIGNLL